jgi:hypothetical protein
MPELDCKMTYTLTLDTQSVQIIGESLAAQPYKAVAPLIANIQAQINAQEAAAKEAAVKALEEADEREKPQEPANT